MTFSRATTTTLLARIQDVHRWCAQSPLSLFSQDLVSSAEAADVGVAVQMWPRDRDDASNRLMRLERICEEVCEKRRNHLLRVDQDIHAGPGRLLLFDPRTVLHDEMASQSALFDVNDMPAWELWIGVAGICHRRDANRDTSELDLNERCGVLCWIPEALLAEADHGINAVAADSLVWLKDVCTPAQAVLHCA